MGATVVRVEAEAARDGVTVARMGLQQCGMGSRQRGQGRLAQTVAVPA